MGSHAHLLWQVDCSTHGVPQGSDIAPAVAVLGDLVPPERDAAGEGNDSDYEREFFNDDPLTEDNQEHPRAPEHDPESQAEAGEDIPEGAFGDALFLSNRSWTHNPLSHRWHGFTFTYTPAKAGGGEKGCHWFVVCCYHKLSDQTRCTKSVTVRANEDANEVKKALMAWCVQAPKYNRKRDHGSVVPRQLMVDYAGTLQEDTLERQAQQLPPPPLPLLSDRAYLSAWWSSG